MAGIFILILLIMLDLHKLVVKELRKAADKIEAGNCEMSIDEAMHMVETLAHIPLSKEEACKFLNVSRPTFDLHVGLGNIPKGRKRTGFKELVWYKDELQKCVERLKR